jgi:site-specific DNA-methyltransferase (adenine-specific)
MEGLMLEINKIYNEDCIIGLTKIPNKSINLIIIDPPYNIGIAEWDKIDNYIEWMSKVFKECERVLKDNGSFYWFHNDIKQIWKLMQVLDVSTEFKFKQMIIWDKFNGTPDGYKGKNAKYSNQRNWAKCAEYCFFYTFQDNDSITESNKDAFIEIKQYLASERNKIKKSLTWINQNILGYSNGKDGMAGNILSINKKGWSFPTEEQYLKLQTTGFFQIPYYKLKEMYESGKYVFNASNESSVWQFPPEPPNGHITPKPLLLIEKIIKASSNENNIILDCFMGSGTTAIAAINTNRNYIGFELDNTYYELAKKRINNHIIENNLQNTYQLIS